jgi:hypothetical protein
MAALSQIYSEPNKRNMRAKLIIREGIIKEIQCSEVDAKGEPFTVYQDKLIS